MHLSITTQLTQENKAKMMKITELEEAIAQEQQQVCSMDFPRINPKGLSLNRKMIYNERLEN